MSEWGYLVALAISVVTLIFGALGLRSRVQHDYAGQLREQLADCERERRRLMHENQWLRDQLMERRDGE